MIETISLKLKSMKDKNTKFLWAVFLFMGIFIYFSSHSQGQAQTNVNTSEAPLSADTYIPIGYTLVPVDIVNSNQISSLLGQVGGQVDLYLTNTQGKKSKKIMGNIKLLRAPLDPDNFAVLIHEDRVSELLAHDQKFFAVILNPKQSKKQKSKKAAPPKFEIEYQEIL